MIRSEPFMAPFWTNISGQEKINDGPSTVTSNGCRLANASRVMAVLDNRVYIPSYYRPSAPSRGGTLSIFMIISIFQQQT